MTFFGGGTLPTTTPIAETLANSPFCISMEPIETNSIITIKICPDRDFDKAHTIQPEMSHQLFEDEQIMGYKSPQLSLWFNGSTMSLYHSFTHQGKATGATNVEQQLSTLIDTSELATFKPIITTSLPTFEDTFSQPCPLTDDQLVTKFKHGSEEFNVYKISLIQSPELLAYHFNVETLAFFYIDEFSRIDYTEPDWNIWYVTHNNSFVGFMTAHVFFSWPDRSRVRLSQIAVIPTFRRKGIASRLLKELYDFAQSINAVDLICEEPSDDLIVVRDVFDTQSIVDSGFDLSICARDIWAPRSKMIELSTQLKIPITQVYRCCEILRYTWLSINNLLTEKELETFKKSLKKRYYSNNISSILAMSKDKRGPKLDLLVATDLTVFSALCSIIAKKVFKINSD
ncbi:hypothetical protein RCL1_002913 [Eukaryota sp. TZLM3-RCL]